MDGQSAAEGVVPGDADVVLTVAPRAK
jgi:hypothetical protein